MEHLKVPMSILKILANGPWMHDESSLNIFDWALSIHKDGDARDKVTCKYAPKSEAFNGYNGALTEKEMKSIIDEGVIDDCFYDDKLCINQHYSHSLQQFFAVCTKEWENHVNRTNKLIGTASGRICK